MSFIDIVKSKLGRQDSGDVICKILDYKCIKGVGNVLKVTPLIYNEERESTVEPDKCEDLPSSELKDDNPMVFNSVCLNIPFLGFPKVIKEKYYAQLVNTTSTDSMMGSACVIVPKTYIYSFDNIEDKIENVEAKKKEFIANLPKG